jgi:hypothetical protein
MTTTPNYSKPKTKSVTAGTLSDPREKDDTAAKMDLFRNQGATNIKNTPMVGAGAILKPAFQAGSKITRDYFTGEVLGKGAYKGTTKQDFERMSRTAQESMYKGYITGRSSGKTDAYGREIKSTGDGGNQVVQAPLVATTMPTGTPTASEVSQSAATDAAEDPIELRKRKAKARGRSPTILTGVTGVTGGLTLGIPSLLGR